MKLLLENGANVHAVKDYALRWAANLNRVKIVKLLLDYGADRTAKNNQAFLAKNYGYEEVVNLLENYFPDSNEKVKEEKNLKDYNTDGRTVCFQCGRPLKIVVGFTGSNLNYCEECEG